MDKEYNFFVSQKGSNWGNRGGYSHSSYRSMIRFSGDKIIVNSTTANSFKQYTGFESGNNDMFTTNDIHSGIFTREEISSVKLSSSNFVGNRWCLIFVIPIILTLAHRFNTLKNDISYMGLYIFLALLFFIIFFLVFRMRVIIIKLKNGKKYVIPWKDSILDNVTPEEDKAINDILFRLYNSDHSLC